MEANKTWKNASSSGENKSLISVGVCFLQSGRIFCIMLTTFLHIGVHNTSRPLETKNYKYVYILCMYTLCILYMIHYILYIGHCISIISCIWMWIWIRIPISMYTTQNTSTRHFPRVGHASFSRMKGFNRVLIGFAPISISPALAPASARPKIWNENENHAKSGPRHEDWEKKWKSVGVLPHFHDIFSTSKM